jgi:hypothetical protein
MSRNRHKRSNQIGGEFVAIKKSMLDTPAWRALSHGARSLDVALKRRYSWKMRENDVYVPVRGLAEELGSHQRDRPLVSRTTALRLHRADQRRLPWR